MAKDFPAHDLNYIKKLQGNACQ